MHKVSTKLLKDIRKTLKNLNRSMKNNFDDDSIDDSELKDRKKANELIKLLKNNYNV